MNEVIRKITTNDEYREACFSENELHRYYLKIVWGIGGILCNFIGLNPSTATELKDDPTIRKCKGFAQRWGCSGIIMTNLFAIRATDPRDMKKSFSPVGDRNDHYIFWSAQESKRVVAAWGNDGAHLNRSAEVLHLLSDLGTPVEYLLVTGTGQPYHPLYVPYSVTPATFPKNGGKLI